MKVIKGDLLDLAEQGYFQVIVHGCNCFCNMGSGIAKQIKDKYTEVYAADLKTKIGDKSKLGKYTYAVVSLDGVRFSVINAYTQYSYGGGKRNADYDAIRRVFKSLKEGYKGCKNSFGFPLIGAGLAKGDWSIISKIIEEEMHGEDITLVKYNK